jgi:CDP-diacylglycerol--glycerol-3-phosphate 3-phosphatidyltransferase/cardiolipin synthase
MTVASKISLGRLLMVPVFAVLAIYYANSIREGMPSELLRYSALVVFVLAAASDAVDGFIAKHFNQCSEFGAFIDPIADKTLLLTGIITLSLIDWGSTGWRIPLWFTALVIVRDCVILGGIGILWLYKIEVKIKPHWSGKVCTFTQMFALGWVMLRIMPFSPLYPCALAGLLTLWSGVAYFTQGLRLLQAADVHKPGSPP